MHSTPFHSNYMEKLTKESVVFYYCLSFVHLQRCLMLFFFHFCKWILLSKCTLSEEHTQTSCNITQGTKEASVLCPNWHNMNQHTLFKIIPYSSMQKDWGFSYAWVAKFYAPFSPPNTHELTRTYCTDTHTHSRAGKQRKSKNVHRYILYPSRWMSNKLWVACKGTKCTAPYHLSPPPPPPTQEPPPPLMVNFFVFWHLEKCCPNVYPRRRHPEDTVTTKFNWPSPHSPSLSFDERWGGMLLPPGDQTTITRRTQFRLWGVVCVVCVWVECTSCLDVRQVIRPVRPTVGSFPFRFVTLSLSPPLSLVAAISDTVICATLYNL